jgi:GxxExxY protein
MNTDEHEYLDKLVETVVGAAYEVSNVLGCGFLEKVYERALARELALRGLSTRTQVSYPVAYKRQCIGEYVADLLVEEQLLVELKCADSLSRVHMSQCIKYLKEANLKLALVINFLRPKVEWKRIIFG